MKTTEKVAEMLRGESSYISGESIAEKLNVSRASVWKAIRELEKNGMTIEASPKKGYKLIGEKYVTPDMVLKHLKDPAVRVRTLRTVSSTNTFLKSIADEEDEGLLVVADSQSAGRGRLGRSFLSPEGTGLYMSLLLKPKMAAQEALSITACAAVAVTDIVRKIAPDKNVGIKWVNDIFADGKKICGILTEAAFNMENGGVDYVILGIGLNLFEPEGGFGEFSSVAGALFPYSDNTADVKCRAAGMITDRFMELYASLSEKPFFEDYRRSLFIIGQPITVTKGGDVFFATALDIDRDFRLLVRYDNGMEEYLVSGETSIRTRQDG